VSSPDARLAAAFTTAMAEVERMRHARWHATSVAAARAEFERIAAELRALHATSEGGVDMERLGALVRAVAAWQPEQGLPLIGALGAVVRAARAVATPS
jgi:hypothetical protein